jgi:hypothetical protein
MYECLDCGVSRCPWNKIWYLKHRGSNFEKLKRLWIFDPNKIEISSCLKLDNCIIGFSLDSDPEWYRKFDNCDCIYKMDESYFGRMSLKEIWYLTLHGSKFEKTKKMKQFCRNRFENQIWCLNQVVLNFINWNWWIGWSNVGFLINKSQNMGFTQGMLLYDSLITTYIYWYFMMDWEKCDMFCNHIHLVWIGA